MLRLGADNLLLHNEFNSWPIKPYMFWNRLRTKSLTLGVLLEWATCKQKVIYVVDASMSFGSGSCELGTTLCIIKGTVGILSVYSPYVPLERPCPEPHARSDSVPQGNLV